MYEYNLKRLVLDLFDKFISRSVDYFLGNRPSLKFIKLFKKYIQSAN